MAENESRQTVINKLRKKAERIARENPRETEVNLDNVEAQLHELYLNQIELGLQNEELRRTAEKLHESHDRYLALYDNAPVGYFTLDRNNIITEINLTACSILGKPRKDLTRTRFTRYIAPGFKKTYHLCRRAAMKSPARETCEIVMLRGDSSTFWAGFELVSSDKGKIHVAMVDISEHRRAEQALRESEERYRDLYENAPNAYLSVGLDGRIQHSNVSTTELLGYSKDELADRPVLDLFADTPDGKDRARSVFKKFLGSKAIYDSEMEIVRADGNPIWISLTVKPVLDTTGKLLAGRVALVNITKRKGIQKELEEHRRKLEEMVWMRTRELDVQIDKLREAEGNLELVIDSLPDGILIIGERGVILFANPAAERMFQQSGAGLVGTTFAYPVTEEVSEFDLRASGSKTSAVEMRTAEIRWKGTLCRLALFRDITPRRKAEKRVRSLSHRLVEVQEKERREIGHALHDEVGGTITILKLALSQARQRQSNNAISALEEINRIVDELAAEVRFISQSVRPSMLDDYGLFEALEWYIQRFQERTGIRINFDHCNIEGRLPPVVETAGYRIMQEALTNAAKYSGAKSIEVGIFNEKGNLMLSIKDTGCGFDPEEVSSGMGITGMQDLAELAGGSLTVDSSPGAGTVVCLEIPFRPTAKQA